MCFLSFGQSSGKEVLLDLKNTCMYQFNLYHIVMIKKPSIPTHFPCSAKLIENCVSPHKALEVGRFNLAKTSLVAGDRQKHGGKGTGT